MAHNKTLPTSIEQIEGIVGEIKAKLDTIVKDLRRQPEEVQREYIETNLPAIMYSVSGSAKKIEDVSDEACQRLL